MKLQFNLFAPEFVEAVGLEELSDIAAGLGVQVDDLQPEQVDIVAGLNSIFLLAREGLPDDHSQQAIEAFLSRGGFSILGDKEKIVSALHAGLSR